MTDIWVLRESFLAYERFHGAFESKESAVSRGPTGRWKFIQRTLPDYMFDDQDPFNSREGAVSMQVDGSLWVAEPQEVQQ